LLQQVQRYVTISDSAAVVHHLAKAALKFLNGPGFEQSAKSPETLRKTADGYAQVMNRLRIFRMFSGMPQMLLELPEIASSFLNGKF
jgi:hypothetical protein